MNKIPSTRERIMRGDCMDRWITMTQDLAARASLHSLTMDEREPSRGESEGGKG